MTKENKRVVICASASLEKEITKWRHKLEEAGYEVLQQPHQFEDDFLENYREEFTNHYSSIAKADIVLVLNSEKEGVEGYIGPGVFAEIAFAIGLNRSKGTEIKIRYINPLPDEKLPYCEELNYWKELGWLQQNDFNELNNGQKENN